MNPWIIILPLLVPLVTAATTLIAWQSRSAQLRISAGGAIVSMGSAAAFCIGVFRHGAAAVQLGGWPAPFGISFVADGVSAVFVLATSILALAVSFYSIGDIDPKRQSFGYFPALHGLIAGANGAYLTGDIFNLYVWLEVMILSSFVLISMDQRKNQIMGSVPYVMISIFASGLLLISIAVLYGLAGTLNLAELSVRLGASDQAVVRIPAMLFLSALGIKAAIFPLFFWLPPSYPTAPSAVVAVFSGVLTKVGVYALLRLFTVVFPSDPGGIDLLLQVVGGITMVTGVLGALAQSEIRRLLSFHIISQIGYMVFAIGISTDAGIAAAIFFTVHNLLVKANLFLIAGAARGICGTFRLPEMGGLFGRAPVLAFLFGVSAAALAGIPPLSGFWGKLLIALAGFEEKHYFLVSVSFLTSVLTLLSMLKIWNEAFWKEAPGGVRGLTPTGAYHLGPILVLTGAVMVLSVFPEVILNLVRVSGGDLASPLNYVRLVLGGGS